MKVCPVGLLITLGLSAGLPLAAQVAQTGTVLVASEGAFGEGSLFPALLSGTHEAAGLTPALSQGLKVSGGAAPEMPQPLTKKQRLDLFWDETYATPGLWVGVAGGAIIDQARHTPLKWDADGNGYTRRFASEYGQLAARNAIHDGLAGIAGLDPRYVACKCQGAMQRGAHAVVSSFVTHRQDGQLALNMPSIAGAYGAGMVSSLWFPHQQFHPLVQGVQFGHEQMGEILIGNLVQEFGPDVQRRLHLHALTARRLARSADDD